MVELGETFGRETDPRDWETGEVNGDIWNGGNDLESERLQRSI